MLVLLAQAVLGKRFVCLVEIIVIVVSIRNGVG